MAKESDFTEETIQNKEVAKLVEKKKENCALLHRLLGVPSSNKKKPDNIYFVSGPC